jgi:hypothetical protein
MTEYVWATPPADYEVKPGDEVQFTLSGLGWLQPPLWLVEQAVSLSDKYEYQTAYYDGSDLVIECRVAPAPDIEIIQAGALPAWILAALLAAGITLLIVKDFKLKVSREQGIEFETATSIPGFMTLALIGIGLLWLVKK